MKRISVFKNLFFSFLLQFTNMLFPLIISPHISSTLGIQNIGKVNFSNSIIAWLLIFCVFGSDTYGVREIARRRNNHEKTSQFFCDIMSIKVTLCVLVLLLYIPLIFIIPKFNKELTLYLVQSIQIVLSILSIDWYFQGMENFQYISLRSIFMKSISFILVFVCIKSENDYIIYAFISIFALSVANILNFNHVRKNITFCKPCLSNIIVHLKKLFVFFISSLVISIYSTFNQVMLGILSNEVSLALFARAKQFFSLCLTLTNTISTTLLPRVSNYYINNKESYNNMLNLSYNIIVLIAVPMATGLVMYAKPLMLSLGGIQFLDSSLILYILSPLLILIPIGTWNFNNRLLPMQYEKIAVKGQIFMALINLTLNLILIPRFTFIGAAISYLITESFGTFYGIHKLRNIKNVHFLNTSVIKSIISTITMLIFLNLKVIGVHSIFTITINIIYGSFIYLSCLVLLKEKNIINFTRIVRMKLLKKGNKI